MKIAEAVAPKKDESINRAVKFMGDKIQSIFKKLEENGWDINEVAPRPNSFGDRETYMRKKNLRNLVERITKREHARYITKGPDFVLKNQEGVDRLLKEVADAAAVQFDVFVQKLESKVGEYDDCELKGDFVWSHSILSVKKADGSVERWKTQTITNYSKYNLAFNQFPTRKVK